MGDGFVVFRARGIWRDSPRAVGLRWLALAVSVRTETAGGGYRARRIGCPAMGAEAEMLPGQRDAGVDVCLDCQWRMARGPLFPMEHYQWCMARH